MDNNLNEIPEWLLKSSYEKLDMGYKSNNSAFLKKTIGSIAKVLCSEFYSERIASQNKLLQRIDPRVKLCTFLFYLLLCSFSKSLLTFLFLACISFMYASISGIELKVFIKRVWLVIPLILLVMSIPAMTNIFIPGKPLFYFYKGLHVKLLFFTLPSDFYLSVQGVFSVIKTVMRVGVSVSFGYLLIVTTRWSDLVKGLSVLKVPMLVTAIFNMTYRYIYILSKTSLESMEARFLRTVGNISNKQNRNFIANRMSFLFVRSHYISDEIYDSMKGRGYFGKPVSLKPLKIKAGDIVWIINNALIALMIIFIGEMIF